MLKMRAENVCIIKREYLEQFHNHMNTLHPKIQFSIEEESDGEVPFFRHITKKKT